MNTQQIQQGFDRFVKKHNLEASWADGLGLRWTPEQRLEHFHNKAFQDTLELVASGYSLQGALERACGVHRGNQWHEESAHSFTPDDSEPKEYRA